MEYDAEFFVLLGFIVFVGVLIYFGVPRMVLKALDARGEAIAAELAQAAKLRQEATSLLASFEKKSAEAEANAAAIVAEARAQAEQLNVEAGERLKEFIVSAPAGQSQDRSRRPASAEVAPLRRACRQGGGNRSTDHEGRWWRRSVENEEDCIAF